MDAAVFFDVAVFFLFLLAVLVIGIGMSRHGNAGENSESYFLAGRGLAWWLIGFSLIAANISTEQFVGMSGNAAATLGLAIASYEWIAALSLVIIAFIFLPRLLKAGVYTIPQFLETRYNKAARTLMSLTLVTVLVCVNIAIITYAGAKAYAGFFADLLGYSAIHIDLIGDVSQSLGDVSFLTIFCWIIGLVAATYVFIGGLKACAWADLIQGSALIVCGCMILYFALGALGQADNATLGGAMRALEFSPEKQAEVLPELETAGAVDRFTTLNSHKLRMNLPWTDTILPITALMFGIWIPNLYYWGLNQYIVQRTLGSQSLAQGQKGIIFAAFLKLLIPFIVIFPGIIAFNLYYDSMRIKMDRPTFQTLKKEYTGESKLFTFNEEFVKFYPEIAADMVAFNADLIGVPIPSDHRQNPMEAYKAIKKTIGETIKNPVYGQTYAGYDYDNAFSLLMQRLVPSGGLRGFALAALLGAIVSTLASLYNAASTIFTMDLYKEYLHKKASEKTLVMVGRICVVVSMASGCCLAPHLADPKFGGVFTFVQEFQGFISSGVLAAFLFGFLIHKAPRMCGLTALLLNPVIYGALMLFASHLSFLDRMSLTFLSIVIVMSILTILKPLKEPFKLEAATTIDLRSSRSAMLLGMIVVIVTIGLYVYFWDYETPMFEGFLESFTK